MKRKKRNKIFIIIVIIFIIYSVWKCSIQEFSITYKIKNYKIQEHFYKNHTNHYDFIIENKKQTFIYSIQENFHKKKQILKDIKNYKENSVNCIIPIYKKDISKDIYCTVNENQVSLDYLIKTKNEDFSKIQEKIKKYNIPYPKAKDTKKEYKKVQIYNNNINEKEAYILWDYKGIYIIKKDNYIYQKILDYDLYDNIMSCIVDHFYVIFENNSVQGIDKIYYYDIEKEKLSNFSLKEKLSKDSYINGVMDNYIYITDKKEKKEYKLDIKKEKIEELDTGTTSYIINDNSVKKELSQSDFFENNQYFKNSKIDNYNYYQKDNKIYKVFYKQENKPILLLELDGIKEWSLLKDEIIILKDDTIYSFTEKQGLRKILENNELKYNYKNIYKAWKK